MEGGGGMIQTPARPLHPFRIISGTASAAATMYSTLEEPQEPRHRQAHQPLLPHWLDLGIRHHRLGIPRCAAKFLGSLAQHHNCDNLVHTETTASARGRSIESRLRVVLVTGL